MMKRQAVFLPIIMALAVKFALATPDVIFSQPPRTTYGGWQSSAEPALPADGWASVFRIADDFFFRSDATVRQVNWWGHSSDSINSTTEYNINQVSGFLIEFFTTNPATNGVGDSIYSEVFSIEATAPTLASYKAYDKSPVFSHSTILSRDVVFTAHTRYWISIAAYVDTEPRWVWFKSRRGNHYYDKDEEVDGIWDGPIACSDGAFELVVPEPATFLLFALGGSALLRKRRQNIRQTTIQKYKSKS